MTGRKKNGPKLLRQWRDANTVSRLGLAEKLGVHRNTVWKNETGRAVPDAATIKLYSEHCGIPLDAWV